MHLLIRKPYKSTVRWFARRKNIAHYALWHMHVWRGYATHVTLSIAHHGVRSDESVRDLGDRAREHDRGGSSRRLRSINRERSGARERVHFCVRICGRSHARVFVVWYYIHQRTCRTRLGVPGAANSMELLFARVNLCTPKHCYVHVSFDVFVPS